MFRFCGMSLMVHDFTGERRSKEREEPRPPLGPMIEEYNHGKEFPTLKSLPGLRFRRRADPRESSKLSAPDVFMMLMMCFICLSCFVKPNIICYLSFLFREVMGQVLEQQCVQGYFSGTSAGLETLLKRSQFTHLDRGQAHMLIHSSRVISVDLRKIIGVVVGEKEQ